MLRQPQKEVIDTIAKACAYGDFDKLQQFAAEDPSCVNKPDDQGYYPLQWAGLNNRVQETAFLLAHNANINQTDHTGQSALHWAAVRGSLPVIEALLRQRADYEIRDQRGYTICHVAAQYGQTAVLYHLALKWGVDVDTLDNDGRTPLHWAAYKGYADTIRLLLVLDARYTLQDKEGCTPLHWAAIKGNGEACTVLLQSGSVSVITTKDMTGCTPAQLAFEKGHRYLGMHLSEYKQKHEGGIFGKNGRLGWLAKTQLCPAIWGLILSLLAIFIYKVVRPPHTQVSPVFNYGSWSVLISSSIGLVFLYYTTTADPGFIPTGWEASNKRDTMTQMEEGGTSSPLIHLKNLDSPALWAGNWQQLCVSCKLVRPLRAKHDAVTDRCIEVFDHFCPWVGNAIGKGNRHFFLVFLWLELYAMTASALLAVIRVRTYIHAPDWNVDMVWVLMFAIVDIFVGISVAALAISQASQVSRNITTNELTNWHRYRYLQTNDGLFSNPFNKGCWRNCYEAFHPHKVPLSPVFLPRDTDSLTHFPAPDHAKSSL